MAAFRKNNVYGVWSHHLFADAAIVEGPAKMIFVAGMAAEDPGDGHIRHLGDCAAQARMAYDKIKAILAAQGADMSHVVRLTTYLVDMRRPARSSASPAWPGPACWSRSRRRRWCRPEIDPGAVQGAPDRPESVHKPAENAQNQSDVRASTRMQGRAS